MRDFTTVTANLAIIMANIAAVMHDLTPVTADPAVIMANVAAVMRDLTPVTADPTVILANIAGVVCEVTPILPDSGLIGAYAPYAGLDGLHRAHGGTVTRSVAPTLPEVATALTSVFCYGLVVYGGFNVYDC